MPQITWIVEREAFSDSYQRFVDAIKSGGHQCLLWNDDWWTSGRIPKLEGVPVVFHGSLGNAHRIARELPWTPGAYCETPRFFCSRWYEGARPWILHRAWTLSTVQGLVDDPVGVAGHLAVNGQVFVRPDSPLKPFSGRVCALDGLTLKSLDFGFYYDDPSIPLVVAPIRTIGREWRFVVVDREVVAGCEYEAETRSASTQRGDAPTAMAQRIASDIEPPEQVYTLDICEVDGELRLLELNPFSGADLYACDPQSVVAAVSRRASESNKVLTDT